MNSKLEYRMMGLVPYNISPIQQAIQFGHAVVEYGLENFNSEEYQEWAKNHKTFIILNGGTTNKDYQYKEIKNFKGTLNNHKKWLEYRGIKESSFYEPDLGDQLTAVVFLVDERIFDNKKYPLFLEYFVNKFEYSISKFTKSYNEEELIKYNQNDFIEYLDLIGGEKNYELKKWLRQFKLA